MVSIVGETKVLKCSSMGFFFFPREVILCLLFGNSPEAYFNRTIGSAFSVGLSICPLLTLFFSCQFILNGIRWPRQERSSFNLLEKKNKLLPIAKQSSFVVAS